MMNCLTKEQLGWMSGVLDGEGCIRIHKHNNWYQPIVTIGNADRRMAYTLKEWLGIGSIIKHKPKGKGYKILWYWSVTSRADVVEVLSMLYPYSIIKKEQIKVVIQFCVDSIRRKQDNYEKYYLELKNLKRETPQFAEKR